MEIAHGCAGHIVIQSGRDHGIAEGANGIHQGAHQHTVKLGQSIEPWRGRDEASHAEVFQHGAIELRSVIGIEHSDFAFDGQDRRRGRQWQDHCRECTPQHRASCDHVGHLVFSEDESDRSYPILGPLAFHPTCIIVQLKTKFLIPHDQIIHTESALGLSVIGV